MTLLIKNKIRGVVDSLCRMTPSPYGMITMLADNRTERLRVLLTASSNHHHLTRVYLLRPSLMSVRYKHHPQIVPTQKQTVKTKIAASDRKNTVDVFMPQIGTYVYYQSSVNSCCFQVQYIGKTNSCSHLLHPETHSTLSQL